MATPYMIRWLHAVANDDFLSHRAKAVAMPLFLHADMADGKNCRIGIPTIAKKTGYGQRTVNKGLAELEEAGYLRTDPLPKNRWNTVGALRHPVFPTHAQRAHVPTHPGRPGCAQPTQSIGPEGPTKRKCSWTGCSGSLVEKDHQGEPTGLGRCNKCERLSPW